MVWFFCDEQVALGQSVSSAFFASEQHGYDGSPAKPAPKTA